MFNNALVEEIRFKEVELWRLICSEGDEAVGKGTIHDSVHIPEGAVVGKLDAGMLEGRLKVLYCFKQREGGKVREFRGVVFGLAVCEAYKIETPVVDIEGCDVEQGCG